MTKRILLLSTVISLFGTALLTAQPAAFSRGYLGVNLRDVSSQDVKDLKLPREAGVYVERVADDSPASRAGLAAKDVVVEYAGMPVWSVRQLQRLVADTPPDREVQIALIRGGERLQKTVKIGESDSPVSESWGNLGRNFRFQMPRIPEIEDFDLQVQPFGRNRGGVVVARRPRLGIQGSDLTDQMAEFLGVPSKEGVLVMEVRADSPAAKAGIKAGDVIVAVNGKAVDSMSELSSEVRDGELSVDLVRDKKRQSVKVTIERPKPRDRSDAEEPARL